MSRMFSTISLTKLVTINYIRIFPWIYLTTFDHRRMDRRDKIQIKNTFMIYDCVENAVIFHPKFYIYIWILLFVLHYRPFRFTIWTVKWYKKLKLIQRKTLESSNICLILIPVSFTYLTINSINYTQVIPELQCGLIF